MTFGIKDTQHNNTLSSYEYHYAECRILLVIMLKGMLSDMAPLCTLVLKLRH